MDGAELEGIAQPGDLIEFFRTGYQHWGTAIGKGEIVHFGSDADGGLLTQKKSKVLRQKITEVAGSDKCRVNNHLDDKYPPRDSKIIVRDACQMVGQVVPYSITTWNCEHFATGLRYGKPESEQVHDLLEGVGVVVLVGVFIAVGATLHSAHKRNEEEQQKE